MRPRASLLSVLTAAALAFGTTGAARAHGGPSDASAALSAVPVALSVVAPSAVLVGGAAFVVVAVESTARGTVWVLERASDGVRISVEFSGKVLSGAATSVGTAIVVTAISTGYVLSAASEAVAFIPNEIGASLLHNERVTDKDRVLR
ncbi:hypothetical protein [Roseateles chitosanitabidus]|jgi:hypothetical protein|uniref:hypothetical protein n=1 Tax=Roseateles chitosanitabidus TaxID=65048 RepID=UPI00082CDE09|nr:hypothetical protein [Roseateles chitosanitabidus]MBO9688023.1 hypothetical protein [Roseateles chitosanitabidus]